MLLVFTTFQTRDGGPESPETHDLAAAILFLLQEPEWEPEHFKKIGMEPELK